MPLRRLLMYLCFASMSGIFSAATPLASAGPATSLHLIYQLRESIEKCPASTHAKLGCALLVGKALESDTGWAVMRRFAVVDAPKPGLPAGCAFATTHGRLSGKSGRIHFKGEGYYCPKTDTAFYRYTFNAAEAGRYGLPIHGVIRYVGSSNTETFTSSAQ